MMKYNKKSGFQKGHPVFKGTEKTQFKKGENTGKDNYFFGKSLSGKDSPNWKGDKVGYEALHGWIKRTYGKANKCEEIECIYPRKNMRGKMMLKPKRYEWSNISGLYKRDREDWRMLCPSCHRKFDYEKKTK